MEYPWTGASHILEVCTSNHPIASPVKGPHKLYSTLRLMTSRSSFVPFWLWPCGKLGAHQPGSGSHSTRHIEEDIDEEFLDTNYTI
jgi:hypothetical protein